MKRNWHRMIMVGNVVRSKGGRCGALHAVRGGREATTRWLKRNRLYLLQPVHAMLNGPVTAHASMRLRGHAYAYLIVFTLSGVEPHVFVAQGTPLPSFLPSIKVVHNVQNAGCRIYGTMVSRLIFKLQCGARIGGKCWQACHAMKSHSAEQQAFYVMPNVREST